MYKHRPMLDMFVKNCHVHSHNTRQSDRDAPYSRTELSKMSFKYRTVVVWNPGFQSVDVNIDFGTYQRHLKLCLSSNVTWDAFALEVPVPLRNAFMKYQPTKSKFNTEV